MVEVSPDELKRAVESRYGVTAWLIQTVTVKETSSGKTVWECVVHVFDLAGHPKAQRAYAWSQAMEDGRRKVFAELHSRRVTGPVEAVKAAIAAEGRKHGG
jgi:hypothetical protein